MSKTGTSRIVWACNPLVPLYRPSPRKRPTLPLKNKFNPLLPGSTTDSNSSNSRLQSLSLNHSIFIQLFLAFILPQSHIYLALFFCHFTSIQFRHFVLPSILIQSLSCQSLHSRFQCNNFSFTCPNFINSINYYQSNFVVLLWQTKLDK